VVSIAEIKNAIDAKHVEALRALELLRGYLEESPLGGNGTIGVPAIRKRKSPRAGTGKIRTAVLGFFAQDFCTIQEAVEQTKLTRAQVRGVVQSPGLKDKFEKKPTDGGLMRYKYIGGNDQ
jgi:hypothetical protein